MKTKELDKKEQELLKLLLSRGYEDCGLFFLPEHKDGKIPNDEWKAMEYLTLTKGYVFKIKAKKI